jgi:hypothetical protein
MSNLLKHVGVIKSTGSKIAVVYKQIPGDKDNALVIFTDTLPERYYTIINELLVSQEAQQENDFAAVLTKKIMSGEQISIADSLHNSRKLSKMPISDIAMTPTPNLKIDLRTLIADIQQLNNQPVVVPEALNVPKVENIQNPEEVARGLLRDAELLQQDVDKKREYAYSLCPSLKPQSTKVVPMAKPKKKDYQSLVYQWLNW